MEALAKCGLTHQELSQVRELAEEIYIADHLALKLNRDLTTPYPGDKPSDFCCYDGERLVGYLSLDDESTHLEITAIVAPAFRRRGIFRSLLTLVSQEAQRRGAERMLLVNYRASESGTAAVKAMSFPYLFSEYRMETDSETMPPLSEGTLTLETVGAADVEELARMLSLTFGREDRSEALAEAIQHPDVRYFLATRNGDRIGHIGVVAEEGGIYIRAFGILPEYRRHGYGRQLLAATLRAMQAEDYTHFSLDVATDNAQALSLYESCGFRTTNIYDYHEVTVQIAS